MRRKKKTNTGKRRKAIAKLLAAKVGATYVAWQAKGGPGGTLWVCLFTDGTIRQGAAMGNARRSEDFEAGKQCALILEFPRRDRQLGDGEVDGGVYPPIPPDVAEREWRRAYHDAVVSELLELPADRFPSSPEDESPL